MRRLVFLILGGCECTVAVMLLLLAWQLPSTSLVVQSFGESSV